jgi:oligopeptide transport system substrate-binding protein
MPRIAPLCLLLPVVAVLVWLGAASVEPRADFVVASDELRTIDPHRVSYLDEIQVAAALFEGLTRTNPLTLQPEPGVAERWTISPDGRTYEFHLRADARWSDAAPVTAADFVYAWRRVLDPRTQAQYASLLFVIDGAEAYYRSRLNAEPGDDAAAETLAAEAVDPRTLRVRLAQPCAVFLELAAFPTLAPAPVAALERYSPVGGEARTLHVWTRPENLVCNGAMTLDRWDFKRRLLLKRNPNYWDAPTVLLDTLEIFIAASPAAALVAYETGRIDLLRGLEPDTARAVAAAATAGRRADFHVSPRFATFFIRVNCARPPLAGNTELRQALALAIDRRALCEHVLGLGETPADTLVPRSAIALMPRRDGAGREILYQPPLGLTAEMREGHRVELSYAECVARAREHLARSGFDPASRAIELSYASDPPQQRLVVEAVQAMWERALGLRVELRVMERKVLSERIRNLDYDVVRSDWFGDYLDPATFLDLFTSGSGQNRTGWSNREYDELIAAAAREADAAQRFELLARAESLLCEKELPILPVYVRSGNYLLRPGFLGLRDNPKDFMPIHWARRGRTGDNP